MQAQLLPFLVLFMGTCSAVWNGPNGPKFPPPSLFRGYSDYPTPYFPDHIPPITVECFGSIVSCFYKLAANRTEPICKQANDFISCIAAGEPACSIPQVDSICWYLKDQKPKTCDINCIGQYAKAVGIVDIF